MAVNINDLARAANIALGDLVPGWVSSDTQAITLQQILTLFQANFVSTLQLAQQIVAPTATAFNAAVISLTTQPSTWLLLQPTGAFAAGTITMPANPVDNQELLVHCTQAVTTLTVAGNGKTVAGAPTTLATNAFFRMRYAATFNTWYRVG